MLERMRHETSVMLLVLVAGTPAVGVALATLWMFVADAALRWTLVVGVLGTWLGVALVARERVARPLRVLANVASSLTQGDFSTSARLNTQVSDGLTLAYTELAQLATTLREQRVGAVEATGLLEAVMAAIDVAVFAFDENDTLCLVNRAGQELLGHDAEALIGQKALNIGLADCLRGNTPRTIQRDFLSTRGRLELRRHTFRREGRPHQLVALTDVSQALKEETRGVWTRLVRVLTHEINNTVAPVKSTAAELCGLVANRPELAVAEPDLARGLNLILTGATALSDRARSYSRLAKLPAPRPETIGLKAFVDRTVTLEHRMPVRIDGGPDVELTADRTQLEELLLNVINNAVDAAAESGGGVSVSWLLDGVHVVISVLDTGPGIGTTSDPFVPFHTTKAGGSGVGLVLSQQIAEMHGGSLELLNREDRRGCVARIRLPLHRP